MKTSFYFSKTKICLIASTILLVGGGCQENLTDSVTNDFNDQVIRVKEGVLHFPDPNVFENYLFGLEEYPVYGLEAFESLLTKIDGTLGQNFRTSGEKSSILEDFIDTPLLEVLDKDGVIAIGKYFISLDFEREEAYVTSDSKNIDLLRSKKFDSSIQKYSFEDELLSILFEDSGISKYVNNSLSESDNISLRIQECPGTPRPGLNLQYRPETNNTNPTVQRQESWTHDRVIGDRQYRIRAKHAYQAAALYFRLKSELEHYERVNDQSSIYSPLKDPFASITYWGTFKPNNQPVRTLDRCFDGCEGCGPVIANMQKVQKIHWEAGRRLTQVNLHMIFRGRIGGDRAGANAIPFEFKLTPINR